MGFYAEFKEAKELIIEKMEFNINANINVLETTDRILGGVVGFRVGQGQTIAYKGKVDVTAGQRPCLPATRRYGC
jgi:Glycosyl hydrolase family 47